jgi:hypothetical protein
VDVTYFSRDFNLMSDSLTHGVRGIHDFHQLAALNGFNRVREATTVPAISAAAMKYGNMKWDTMLTSDKSDRFFHIYSLKGGSKDRARPKGQERERNQITVLG